MSENPVFTITRSFKAPRQRVWDAWTRPDFIAQWFGPRGVSNTMLECEVRPGGMLHTRMDMSNGGRIWGKFVYREVTPPSRLVWAHSFSNADAEIVRAPFSASWPLELLTTVTFEEEPDGTKVTLEWTPLGATPEEVATFAAALPSMDAGWTGSFDQLDTFLAT